LAIGYRARVVCVDARFLDASFCGREFDAGFIADLPPAVDACGENGEFHTFVFDGPRLRQPVPHALVRVHELKQAAPAPGHYFVAELR
ncbi:MAG TPA: adenosine nucleotide hydrolase, partial [Albitalea sp.]|nr:adenosine nucleotide hydrolase [Albitalea sp.]